MPNASHHYVPQMYLKGFFDPKKVAKGVNALWRYRPGGKPEEKGTKKIAEQTNFYDLPEVDPKDNDIEQMFSQIERIVAWDLKKLRSGKIPLRPQERVHLANYFALQYTRTPWFRKLADHSVIQLKRAGLKRLVEKPGAIEEMLAQMQHEAGKDVGSIESLREYTERVVKGEILLIQGNKAWSAKVMLQHADDTGDLLFNTRWSLLEAPPGTAFITSDSPVGLIDPSVLRLGPDGFRPSQDFQFTVPVSPRFMLIGERKDGPDHRVAVRPEDVAQANVLLMHRAEEVYASFESKELQGQFDKIVRERAPSIRDLPDAYLQSTIDRALAKRDQDTRMT
jgi:hypothetical protein